jgi:hypothetical protein
VRNRIHYLALFAFALLLASHTRAATINATSASLAHVQEAVESSVNGDTVTIPIGTVTWNSTLEVTNCITLVGAGTNETIINNGAGHLINWVPGGNTVMRLSGMNSCPPADKLTLLEFKARPG